MPKVIALDTETTGLDLYRSANMFAFSFCTEGGLTQVCRLDGTALRARQSTRKLKELVNGDYELVFHNAKFDLTAIERYLQCRLPESLIIHDTYIQSHILQSNHPSQKLKDLAWELCGITTDDEKAVKPFAKDGGNYQQVPEHLMNEYQKRDAERTMLLHLFFYPKIIENESFREIYQMEMDLIKVTQRMEERGVLLDPKRCVALSKQLQEQADQVIDTVEEKVGKRLNLRRHEDVYHLLFDWGGVPVTAYTPSGKPSTDKDVLLDVQIKEHYEAIDLLLKYRSYSRGATMVLDYLDLCDEDLLLHPDINTCAAKTSRESCSRPNLQNVSKSAVLKNPYAVPARTCFRPKVGFVNLHIDYAGIELRLLIHYSGEEELIQLLNDRGDPHALAAEVFYGTRFTEADGEARKVLRTAAKNANFAIPYGAGANQVSSTLLLSPEEGAQRYAAYRKRFPKLVGLNNTIANEVRKQGYVTTAFGRVLYVSREIAYAGTNYLIQGSAAGVLKRAQVRVAKYLREATSDRAGIILPIHDEIVIEYPRQRMAYLQDDLRNIRDLMIDFPQFSVPLEIEAEVATRDWEHKASTNWSE